MCIRDSNTLIKKGYKILELDTYFTSGPEETRAWTIPKNCTAPKAASEIHTDFEKGFISLDELNAASDKASNNLFFERKYNQVSYLCNVLGKLDDLRFIGLPS